MSGLLFIEQGGERAQTPLLGEYDPAMREKHYQQALRYLHTTETLGAQTLRSDAGVRTSTFTQEQLVGVVTRFRKYAQRAYDNGYQVGPDFLGH